MNRYPPSRPNIIHDYALQEEFASRKQPRVDRPKPTSNNIPTYPASPHQLDELAAASIFLIRNNNNTTATAAKKAATTTGTTSLYKKMMGNPEEESNNIQPKSPEELANSNRADSDDDAPEEIYHDYAQEEDPTEKIKGEYAGHSSLIEHEDETTRSLANQKLPAKLAAMLSDPGEFIELYLYTIV